jgi:hypothetical protein
MKLCASRAFGWLRIPAKATRCCSMPIPARLAR